MMIVLVNWFCFLVTNLLRTIEKAKAFELIFHLFGY